MSTSGDVDIGVLGSKLADGGFRAARSRRPPLTSPSATFTAMSLHCIRRLSISYMHILVILNDLLLFYSIFVPYVPPLYSSGTSELKLQSEGLAIRRLDEHCSGPNAVRYKINTFWTTEPYHDSMMAVGLQSSSLFVPSKEAFRSSSIGATIANLSRSWSEQQ